MWSDHVGSLAQFVLLSDSSQSEVSHTNVWPHTHTHTEVGMSRWRCWGIKGDMALWSASHLTSSPADLLLLFITGLRPPPVIQVSWFLTSSSSLLSSQPDFILSSPTPASELSSPNLSLHLYHLVLLLPLQSFSRSVSSLTCLLLLHISASIQANFVSC